MKRTDITEEAVDNLCQSLNRQAEASGYHLNTDTEFTRKLVRGLLVNEERYGYWACPCRLASGNKEKDLDIICPCDYRDPDLAQYDQCYCALYVSEQVLKEEKETDSIPERRGAKEERIRPTSMSETVSGLSFPIWRCRVCGYLCARESPPEACPVCKAKRERFEKFIA